MLTIIYANIPIARKHDPHVAFNLKNKKYEVKSYYYYAWLHSDDIL